jgi:hypothetical protein
LKRLPAVGLAIALTGLACTQADDPSRSHGRSPSADLVDVRIGRTTARHAMRRLCIKPEIVAGPVRRRPTPPAIAEVESQVQAVRALEFRRAVNVEPITPAEIDRRLSEYFDAAYPRRFYARRTDAWATIGAIPRGVGILEALERYQQGQVLGFYNSQNEELVYTGDEDLDRIEQFVLAHELTHAIDDQHFDLDRLDELAQTCDDDRFLAALGAVEGSANHFATQVIIRFPVTEIGDLSGGGTRGVPPLIVELQAYPYTLGQVFVDRLADDGGTAAVNRALRTFPITTEQVLHPSKFPGDTPRRVDVPDFAPTFGPRWRDHDVMLVGELWLRTLLDLRLDEPAAERAAAGWDGGIYRAWSNGDDVVVVLRTVWDTQQDATEFSATLDRWARQGPGYAVILAAEGNAVSAGFASSEALMPALESALRSL